MLRKSMLYAYKQREKKVRGYIIARNIKQILKEPDHSDNIRRFVFSIKISNYKDYWINKLIISAYKKNIKVESISKYIENKYNVSISASAIYVRMNELNIKRNKHVFNRVIVNKKEEKEIVKKYLKGQSSIDLMKEYGFKTSESITNILKSNGVKPRTQIEVNNLKVKSIDFNFINIDSNFKAYYLGILLTDGYLNTSRNNVSVQMCDKDIIDFIAKNTKSTVIAVKKKNAKSKIMFRTSIYSKEYRSQLERLGVVDNKSLTLKGPTLYKEEKKYIPYIIRGIIDGDGWIRKDGREFFICSASSDFILWCKNELESLGMIKLNLNFTPNDYSGIYCLRSGRKENIKILKERIYNVPFGMNRKYELLYRDVQRL